MILVYVHLIPSSTQAGKQKVLLMDCTLTPADFYLLWQIWNIFFCPLATTQHTRGPCLKCFFVTSPWFQLNSPLFTSLNECALTSLLISQWFFFKCLLFLLLRALAFVIIGSLWHELNISSVGDMLVCMDNRPVLEGLIRLWKSKLQSRPSLKKLIFKLGIQD